MSGIGPVELVALLAVLLSFGGAGGLPLSMPPLPPDPVLARVAPDECLFHMETAGLAAPGDGTPNLTERMLSDPEMRGFLAAVVEQLGGLLRQRPPAGPASSQAISTLLEAVLTMPLAVTVTRCRPSSPEGPPEIVASLVIRVGDRGEAVRQAAAWLAASLPLTFETVEIGGRSWQRVAGEGAPGGGLCWGVDGGSFVVAVGPGGIGPLVARMDDAGRASPAWRAAIEKRLPLDRPSTLTYVHAGEALRIATSLPAADRDRLLAFLEASGLGRLETIGTVSGMTAEGIASATWLGFEGPPRGLFAPPATGIGPRPLSRIPADAIMAQSWSLDLSALLATGLGIVEATDPRTAAEFRTNLERVRAVAGFDIDTHLLAPLGPDWTLFSVPAPGGMLPNVALVAGLRDRATFARTHKALLGIARNAAAAGGLQLSIRTIPYRDQTLFCLESTNSGTPIPVTPTWCLTEDALLVTLSPQLMRTLLSRPVRGEGLDGVAGVKSALAAGEPTLVGVIDPVWLVGSLCGLYELAAPMARGVMREQGLQIDPPHLPPWSAIRPYVRPHVSVIRHVADGIVLESTGTIPLGPLTAGGGVAGISPASTPVLVGLLLPAVQAARDAARRTQVSDNFKQVMLAMATYEAKNGRFPAQAICAADGRPLLSWRVALLPFLDAGDLHRQFRRNEPWDSEHNLALLGRMPAVYADPAAPAGQAARGLTTVQAITGEGTAFLTPEKTIGLAQISDGSSRTIAIVEALPDNAVPWTKPDDVEFDPDRPLVGVGNPRRAGGLFAAGFFDGHIRMIEADVAPEVFRALVTPSGGETVSLD